MMDESSTVEASSLEEEEKVIDELEESHYENEGDATSNKCCIRIGGSVKGTLVACSKSIFHTFCVPCS